MLHATAGSRRVPEAQGIDAARLDRVERHASKLTQTTVT
jgi:hypothetical protein